MKNKVLKTKKNLKNSVKHFSNNSVDRKHIKKDMKANAGTNVSGSFIALIINSKLIYCYVSSPLRLILR